MNKRSLVTAVITVMVALLLGAPTPTEAQETTARIIVRSRSSASQKNLRHLGRVHREIEEINTSVIEVPIGSASSTMDALKTDNDVVFVEEDGVAEADVIVNDPMFGQQWGVKRIGADKTLAVQGAPIVVAVVDSGVDFLHPDLIGQLLAGWDFVNNDDDPTDDSGHGTAMTGIVVATANNSIGIAGVAPQASVLPIKVMDETNFGFFSNIAAGIVYAVDNGASVINLSLSAGTPSQTIQTAVDYALAHDVVVVASTGNYGVTNPTYPAAIPGVVGVMATDEDDDRAWFSNYGSWVMVAAPGTNIKTTLIGGDYASVQGTSASAALVSGAFALLRSAYPELTATEAITMMTNNADDLGLPGRDAEFGFGLVDIATALFPPADSRRPEVTLISPERGNLIEGIVSVVAEASDNVGVEYVDLEVDGVTFDSTDTEPFNFNWDTSQLTPGVHSIRAVAHDQAGNHGRSKLVKIYVTNGQGLLVTRATVNVDSGSLRLKAIVRLPEGQTFDPTVDDFTLDFGAAMSVYVGAGTMEVSRSTAKLNDGDLRVKIKPSRIGETYSLNLSARNIDLSGASEMMDVIISLGGNTIQQPLVLGRTRSGFQLQ